MIAIFGENPTTHQILFLQKILKIFKLNDNIIKMINKNN